MVGIQLHLSGPTESIDVASHSVNLEANSLSEECGYPINKLYWLFSGLTFNRDMQKKCLLARIFSVPIVCLTTYVKVGVKITESSLVDLEYYLAHTQPTS